MDMTTTLRDSDYYIKGSKIIITDGDVADTVVAFATRDKNLRHKGISGLIVDQETLEDTLMPVANLIGEETKGFRYDMEILDSSRVIIAPQCVGIAQAAFEAAIRHAQQWPSL